MNAPQTAKKEDEIETMRKLLLDAIDASYLMMFFPEFLKFLQHYVETMPLTDSAGYGLGAAVDFFLYPEKTLEELEKQVHRVRKLVGSMQDVLAPVKTTGRN